MPAFQVNNALAPAKGPLALPDTLVFAGIGAVVHKIYSLEEMSEHMDLVQNLWVDNSQNPELLVISVNITQQILRIPRFWQGVVPLFTILPLEFYAATVTPEITIPFMLLNMPMPIGGWAAV